MWPSFPFIPIFGSPCNTFPISPTPWRCCKFPLAEFVVEGKALTVWADFENRRRPDSSPVGQALRAFWFVCI
jgi:hypothetical protein